MGIQLLDPLTPLLGREGHRRRIISLLLAEEQRLQYKLIRLRTQIEEQLLLLVINGDEGEARSSCGSHGSQDFVEDVGPLSRQGSVGVGNSANGRVVALPQRGHR